MADRGGATGAFASLDAGATAAIAAPAASASNPFANLAYVNLHADAFAEKGGAAAPESAATNTGITFTTLGVHASTDVAFGQTATTLRGMLGWCHAFGDTVPLSTLALAGGSSFTIASVPMARDAMVVEAGLHFSLTSTATLGVSYGGQFGSGRSDQSARANFNWKF
jgi:outer membrane autotransporter protein